MWENSVSYRYHEVSVDGAAPEDVYVHCSCGAVMPLEGWGTHTTLNEIIEWRITHIWAETTRLMESIQSGEQREPS